MHEVANSVIVDTIALLTLWAMSPHKSPQDLIPLHPIHFRILLALRETPLHGYRLVKEIEARDGQRLQPANLYRRIRGLRKDGLVEEVPAPHDSPDDRERKFFTLSTLGRRTLTAEVERMQGLLEEAGALVPGGSS